MSPNAAAFSKAEFGIELTNDSLEDVSRISHYFRDILQSDAKYKAFMETCKSWKTYEGYSLNDNKMRMDHFKQALRLFAESTTDENRRQWLALMFVNGLCHAGYKIKYESVKRRAFD